MIFNNISVMILAAGYGTRLKHITKDIPKPLVQINNKTLLGNIIENLIKINCKEIIINTHYKHQMINNFINKNFSKENIICSYEKELLDTGGGVKNALKLFSYQHALILNSDVFWTKENFLEISNLVKNFTSINKCKLLLAPYSKVYGVNKQRADFNLNKGLVSRYCNNKEKLFYSGAQIIYLNILKKYNEDKFSFNLVWNDLINKNNLLGKKMKSDLYHVGNIEGLKIAKNFIC